MTPIAYGAERPPHAAQVGGAGPGGPEGRAATDTSQLLTQCGPSVQAAEPLGMGFPSQLGAWVYRWGGTGVPQGNRPLETSLKRPVKVLALQGIQG